MVRESAVKRVLTLLFMGRHQHLTQKSVGQGIGEQMEHDPEGHERLQVHKRRRDVEPEVEGDRAPVVREDDGDPTLQGTARCLDAGRGIL